MGKEFSVSQSKVNLWRMCRQAFYFKHVEQLQRKLTRRPFMFGTIVHRMIEAHALGQDPFKVLDEIGLEKAKLFAAEREMYGDIIEDIRIIMADYIDFWPARDLKFIEVDGRAAEHEFSIELEDGILFKGQVDAIGVTPSKMTWLVENKTFDKLPSDDHRWRNLQVTVYTKAIQEMGWVKKIHGVAWNYVRSHPPTEPEYLEKSKRLSKRQITTLPSVIKAAVKKHGLKLEDHRDLLEDAETSRSNYFQRIFTPYNETVADMIFAGFVETAIDIRDNHLKRKEKSLGRGCEWCDYEAICRAEFTGGDVDFVKEREFTREDPEAYRRTARESRAGGTAGEVSKSAKRSPKLRVLRP